ncbi:argininosuccinate lyase [Bosea sp. (in: a-proteobacteria)]|uniref:argininosuccinate lyase n=1 Tax=Bosea sp. (in: a-proteobacteria) TaxID=1871050 RepID=UPI00261CD968|nr:argininosuccinate lyase [Bosea sp. (in: a-proteobacteria)]MCO5091860.1 argininosuccinate lyase [Bosea sp. (in: a-proteobacteria)]
MSDETTGANTMWGGRFTAAPAEVMRKINPSIGFDHRLYRQDIAASKVHAAMLARQGIIAQADNEAIQAGLDQIRGEIERGELRFSIDLEDIHMNVEARLKEIVGEPAGRLHTARSRNDQAVTDVRLWMRDAIDGLDGAIRDLQGALIARAGEHASTIMPGFTHMQVAQPVTFGHHLMAYVEMFGRDRERLAGARERTNVSPLGAAALAGTAFPIDRHFTAAALGFARPTENSMDSVGSRDHICELLFCCAMLAVNLSRLNEEITLWCSDGFRFVSLSDAFTTGSSIMPQKRNPDAAELVRGKTGRVVGSLTALLVTVKGLPMTFMKDMQEDKEPMFDALETVDLCVAATAGMVRDLTVRPQNMRAFLDRGFPTATDLADWLVREAGVPFREAHHITARIVALAEAKGSTLQALDLASMRSVDPRITDAVFAVLAPEHSVKSRLSYGGTAPDTVREAIARARQRWLR